MAGGIGRAIGVDPVLVRVAFVVLTIFGGFGALLYVLGWLLLPADHDEVSAGEALIGRGRSSVPPILAVGLAVVAMLSLVSMVSWGLPFWPLVIAGVIVFMVAKKHGAGTGCAKNRGQGPHGGWGGSTSGTSWGEQAERWVAQQPWSGRSPGQDPQSPFDTPPFWDDGSGDTDSSGRTARSAGPGQPTDSGARIDPQTGEPVPPAWDPLGVAPFAWDLPDPAPAPAPPPAPRRRSVVGRVTMGGALLVGGVMSIFALTGGLPWAFVSASALAVVALGLLIGSLRGRGHSLIAPGIFLSMVTLALAVTGLDAKAAYGQQTWRPTSVEQVDSEYVLNGGQGVLDLSAITVLPGETIETEVEVRAGQARVIVPQDSTVEATCSTNAGEVSCLGQTQDGLQQELTVTRQGNTDQGSIDLTVHVGAGQAEVVYG